MFPELVKLFECNNVMVAFVILIVNILEDVYFFQKNVLIVMLFLSLFNYYQAWVQNRQTSLSSMATRLAYQIEDYRYQASHIYKLANDKTTPTAIDKLSVTEMRHDIFSGVVCATAIKFIYC